MRRREFLTLMGGAALAWPLAVRAQRTDKLPTIGFFGPTTASVENQWLAAFVLRLRELSWMEGRNVAIEVRWAEGRSERFTEIADELVQSRCHSHIRNTAGPRGKAGNIGHPDRFRV